MAPGSAPGAPAPPAPQVAPDQRPDNRGGLELIGNTTMLGLFAGITFVDLRDMGDHDNATLAIVGTTLAGAGLGYLIADSSPVSRGQGSAVTLGLMVGAFNGALWLEPMGLDDDREEVLSTLLVTSTIGVGSAYLLGRSRNPTRGDVFTAGTFGVLGMASVGLIAGMLEDDTPSNSASLVLLSAGLDVGIAVGFLAAPRLRWSESRIRRISTATTVGAGAGVGIGALLAGDRRDSRATAIAALIGMWGGFAIGVGMTENDQHTGTAISLAPSLGNGTLGLSLSGSY